MYLQFVQTKLGLPNFQGFPFENFQEQTNKFRKWTDRLQECYNTHIRRQISRNPNDKKARKNIEKLRAGKLLCPDIFPGLMAQLATHKPRLPHKPP